MFSSGVVARQCDPLVVGDRSQSRAGLKLGSMASRLVGERSFLASLTCRVPLASGILCLALGILGVLQSLFRYWEVLHREVDECHSLLLETFVCFRESRHRCL